ncbi:MAG: iron-containing alcohol dehydrogenase [Christensenellales bacterium]|jgi:alcohol dehydrogenase
MFSEIPKPAFSLQSFSYYQPVKLVFGQNVSDSLQDYISRLGFSRGVLICDKLFSGNGLAEKIRRACPSLVAVFSDVTPNPVLADVEKAAALLKETDAALAVALGGGSAIDLAKFACSMVFASYPAEEYFYKRKVFSAKHLPLIAVPTTAGTGSEVTSVSVCNDERTGIKAPLACDNFYPYMAVVDPVLTLSVPPRVTAVTGMDGMSHALEAFWSVNHLPVCDMYAEESLRLIFANLEEAYFNGNDVGARSGMSLGALFAGLAFALTKTAAVHACSYPLSMDYNLSHGEACAFTLDMFLRENAQSDLRLDALAKRLGFRDAAAMADKIAALKETFGFRTSFKDIGCTDVKTFADRSLKHPLFANNPKKYTLPDLTQAFLKYYGK